MVKAPQILIVDDEYGARESLKIILDSDYALLEAASYDQAREVLGRCDVDLILLDISMPGKTGLDLLRDLRREGVTLPVVMVTATQTLKTAVQAMKFGAADYITKPYDVEEIRAIVKDLLRIPKKSEPAAETQSFQVQKIVGYDTTLAGLFKLLKKLAKTDSTILIQGESGTGKELIARAVHAMSQRSCSPFVPVHLGAVAENLVESELFGHVRGAFTGADKDRAGAFELAGNGTLFLDEIAEIQESIQVKLLRVLQEKEFRAVGDNHQRRSQARIIAATNKDLYEMVQDGKYREDLFYRLNVVPLRLPPLRERREDIPALCRYLTGKICLRIGMDAPSISDEVTRVFMAYSWPGNIRELENTLENMLLLSDGDTLEKRDLPAACHRSESGNSRAIMTNGNVLQSLERETIELALLQNNGVLTSTAKFLGTTRRILKYKMDKLGITKSEILAN